MQATFKKADVIIAVLLLCAALLLFLLPLLRAVSTDNAVLVVTFSDGREQNYPLTEDTTLTLTGNGHTLTVVIENGVVRVSESSCPDGICRMGSIGAHGETLVCAPAGIALTVKTERGGDIDAIVG